MACGVIESAAARQPLPPADLMARSRACLGSVMTPEESIASHQNQALLHWRAKAALYNAEMTLGKRIQAARKRLEISQRELGEEFGISPAAVSAWERDDTVPEFGNLCRLPGILKVPAEWLLTGGDAPPLDGDLARTWARLDAAQRAHAMRYLDLLAAEANPAPKKRQKAS
jgi:transcriptional regulator with XRE-family HTH domain